MSSKQNEDGVRKPRAASGPDTPRPADVLEAYGLTCGQLEPLIAQRMRALAPGDVLEVRSDEAAAAEGIAAWSWLSGNALVSVAPDEPPRARYYVRKA